MRRAVSIDHRGCLRFGLLSFDKFEFAFEWVEKDEGKKKFFVCSSFIDARLVVSHVTRISRGAIRVVIDISIWLARCSFRLANRIVVRRSRREGNTERREKKKKPKKKKERKKYENSFP